MSKSTMAVVEEEECRIACDEALNILHSLRISEENLKNLLMEEEYGLIGLLTKILQQHSACQSRAYATFMLKSIIKSMSPIQIVNIEYQLFVEIVEVLRDQISYNATKAALRVLQELCSWGKNRIKAAEAGAIMVLIELLLDNPETRLCEMVLIVLDTLCGCAEGREQLLRHGAGIAAVSKLIHTSSHAACDAGVRILYLVAKFSATPGLLQDMLQLRIVSKLCLVLHLDCGMKTKDKAKEILRLHSRSWKNSRCIAPQFQSSYPR